MSHPRNRIISIAALNYWISFAFAINSPASETQKLAPSPGRSWSVPLAAEAMLDLVWIPPGSFLMGSPSSESGRKSDEGPQAHVTLSQGFWLGKYFVTIGQWKKVMGIGVREQLIQQIANGTRYEIAGKKQTLRALMNWSRDAKPETYLANEDNDLPMYFVSWNDAMAFCARLNETERAAGRLPAEYAYNLPTEAQWEYACRAGTTEATYAGPANAEVLAQIAWYDANSALGYTGRGLGPTRSGPRAVGHKDPNAWGLCDMLGNIWQWCRDWYGPYSGGNITDPVGPPNGTGRVNRGGSFGSSASAERSASRAANPQFEASAYRGFRVALCPVQPNR